MPNTFAIRSTVLLALTAAAALFAPRAFAATETVLYAFQGGTDGASPYAAPTVDVRGNLYGTTLFGGAYGYGTVYELAHSKSGWSEKTLYSFTNGADGSWAYGGVILDSDGNIYGGTRSGGGPNGCGVVYELSPGRHGQWTQKVLYTFPDHEGCEGGPMGALTLDSKGNLYGGAVGNSPCGGFYYYGVVFELRRTKGGWKEQDLHDFCGHDGDGPDYGQLVFDPLGNLYGTSGFGGGDGRGVVFEMSPGAHHQWTFTPIHSFTQDEGGIPEGGLTLDTAGHFHSVESGGGPDGLGSAFELAPTGPGQWTDSTVHVFNGSPDGVNPFQNPAFDANGNLFGTTYNGGDIDSCYDDCGVIYELTPREGGGWSESVVYDFASQADGADGYAPIAGLVFDGKGHFFGTTVKGGAVTGLRACDCGVVYEFTP
ncbi:MAG TPA: choice-of-anchor tandem repeat GloVer-containing protein [Rhizomicrobium sp.]|jgi:uncharacterized repeat protein (TIGR03803 family)|nr:choice-of-anchor tandem repeat GloVer-containing protein [Rhizomicrobium sp.]